MEELGQPLRADVSACSSHGVGSARYAESHRAAMRRWLSDKAWAYAHDDGGRPLDGQPELLKVNDERAAACAVPRAPSGGAETSRSLAWSARPYSEITGSTKARPFDAALGSLYGTLRLPQPRRALRRH